MTPDIFDIVALVIIFLCYCAGRYWLGPSDAKKASIKHDGRRALYRGGILALVLAFIVWRTTYGFWPAVLTWVSGCLAGSIGVRLGWNAARGLDWRYLGSTSWDDRMCISLVCRVMYRETAKLIEVSATRLAGALVTKHQTLYTSKGDSEWVAENLTDDGLLSYNADPAFYRKAVHRAGLIRTIVEGAVSVGGYALILFA